MIHPLRAVLPLLFLLTAGCNPGTQGAAVAPRAVALPYEGAAFSISCADPIVTTELSRLASGWARRTGARVDLSTKPDADVLVIPPTQLGAELVKEPLEAVPQRLLSTDHPVHLSRALSIYRDRLTCWGSKDYAIPLAGDGAVLVYRIDRLKDPQAMEAFRVRFRRPLTPPMTYEDIAELGEIFGPGSLPPLPADSGRLVNEFNRIAACYDRPALVEGDLGRAAEQVAAAGNRILSFHHNIETGEPRLMTPGFLAAAKWFQVVQPYRTTGENTDPVAALTTGKAVLALLTLQELGRLPKEGDLVSRKFGIMPQPGTRICFDPETGASRAPTDRATNVNFIPYHGANSWVGVVRAKTAASEAAFEFLADLATSTRSSELLTDPKLGFGPFRSEHLDPSREDVFARYGLDTERTKQLVEALRKGVSVTLANPVFAPRTPDQAELMSLLSAQVRRVAKGEIAPDAAMQLTTEEWKKLDATRPKGIAAEWRRKTAGLN